MTLTHSEGQLELVITATGYQQGFPGTRYDEPEPEHWDDVRVWLKSPCGDFYNLEITQALSAEAIQGYGELALEALHEGKAERESRRETEC